MTKEPERLCLWCEHFYIDVGTLGYSEYTPGSDFDMSCNKNHWNYKSRRATEDEYRACLLAATVCSDYKFKQELVQIKPKYKEKRK